MMKSARALMLSNRPHLESSRASLLLVIILAFLSILSLLLYKGVQSTLFCKGLLLEDHVLFGIDIITVSSHQTPLHNTLSASDSRGEQYRNQDCFFHVVSPGTQVRLASNGGHFK